MKAFMRKKSASQERGSILPASVAILMVHGFQKPYRGLLPLVFDLPPNPSIDHLVPMIHLEYDGCPGEDGAQATTEIVV
jgi:hypothetical protein